MGMESILNPVLAPFLRIPTWLSLAIIATLMSLLITLIYRWMTDQKQMKQLKDDMKEMQKKMKENRSDTSKVMKMQKQAMESNMKYMVQSMKPTLVTFIPVILIFAWLSANIAYEPLQSSTPFKTTATFAKGTTGSATISVPDRFTIVSSATQEIKDLQASWIVKGPEGEYFLNYELNGEQKQKQVIISKDGKYGSVEQRYTNSAFKSIKINNNPIHPFGTFSIFGWMPGWLGTYIIFSIASSLIFRKLLKVY